MSRTFGASFAGEEGESFDGDDGRRGEIAKKIKIEILGRFGGDERLTFVAIVAL